jgi:hypothetical protein
VPAPAARTSSEPVGEAPTVETLEQRQ